MPSSKLAEQPVRTNRSLAIFQNENHCVDLIKTHDLGALNCLALYLVIYAEPEFYL